MERVADEHRATPCRRALRSRGVAVPQQHELLEDEEQQDAGEQRAEHACGGSVERLRQEREQRDAEQRADGVADQPRDEPGASGIVEEENAGGDEQPPSRRAGSARARSERRRTSRMLRAHPVLRRSATSDVLLVARGRVQRPVVRTSTRMECQRPSFLPVAGVAEVGLLAQLVGDARGRRIEIARSRGRFRSGRRCRR